MVLQLILRGWFWKPGGGLQEVLCVWIDGSNLQNFATEADQSLDKCAIRYRLITYIENLRPVSNRSNILVNFDLVFEFYVVQLF